MSNTQDKLDQYLNGLDGKHLMESFSLSSTGVWLVAGQGDERGYNAHVIGYFSGKLDDVLRMAVNNKHWDGWGSHGGTITPIDILDIKEFSEHKERLRRDRDDLLAQVAAIDAQLGK